MKTVLFIAESVGTEASSNNDDSIIQFLQRNDGAKDVSLYCREIILSKKGDYIRSKGVHIYIENGLVPLPEAFDEAIVLDEWGKESLKKITVKEKKKDIIKREDSPSVLIVTDHLVSLGGSETWTYSVAKEFMRINWDVEVYANHVGEAFSEKLPIVDSLREKYDLILINHNTCMDLVKDISGKKVFTSHGIFPEMEHPVDGADAYVSVSEEVQIFNEKMGFKSEIIRNGIDCSRFKSKKAINSEPKRVLSLCQGFRANLLIEQACSELGIEFVSMENRVWDVEEEIMKADIVFSLGRGAYEAMACERAVVVYDTRPYRENKSADGMVNSKNAMKLARRNFSGRENAMDWDVNDIKEEITKKYRKSCGVQNRSFVIRNFNLRKQVKKYIDFVL